MSVAVSAVVLVAWVALAVAVALRVVSPAAVRWVNTLRPRARVSWLTGLLAAPLVSGLLVLALALGHCVAPRLVGLADDCARCALCVFAPGRAGAAAVALAALLVGAFAWRLGAIGRGVLRARRARSRLQMLARRGADGVWRVPGARAFVVGWPAPAVCVGEELTRALAPLEVQAVTAHEHAHRARGDVTLRIAARTLATAHLPGTARALLAALDLAIEQACDERAADAVADPLIVADALIGSARVQQAHAAEGGIACAPATLAARIEALCAAQPHGVAPAWPRRVAALALLSALAAAVRFDHQIHRAAEAALTLINR